MTKSHILDTNTSTRIDIHVGQLTNESKICLKCDKLVSLKDVTPYKRRTLGRLGILEEVIKMNDHSKIDKSIAPENAQIK